MKRIAVGIAALTLAFVFSISVNAKITGYTLGDSDNNGDVEILDATIAQRLIADMITDSDRSITRRADVDRNLELDIIDVTWIQRYVADMETPYPIGAVIKPVYPTDPYELPIV